MGTTSTSVPKRCREYRLSNARVTVYTDAKDKLRHHTAPLDDLKKRRILLTKELADLDTEILTREKDLIVKTTSIYEDLIERLGTERVTYQVGVVDLDTRKGSPVFAVYKIFILEEDAKQYIKLRGGFVNVRYEECTKQMKLHYIPIDMWYTKNTKHTLRYLPLVETSHSEESLCEVDVLIPMIAHYPL